MRVRALHLRWTPLQILSGGALPYGTFDIAALSLRMQVVLESWEGTKYGSGQRCRGVLADCVGAVFGCIDDVDGRPRAQAPTMPPDSALHDPDTSAAALAALRALYEPVEVLSGSDVQPFDILVVGPAFGGPSHAILVGPQKNTLWHCTPSSGFHRAGWALGTGYEICHGAFRIGDRERWII